MNAPKTPPKPKPSNEVREALQKLRPYFVRSWWFTAIATVLVLVSSWYMLEVYERVVNSRNMMTLLMLTVVALAAYAVMEVLEWSHSEEMREAGNVLDASLRDRVFSASFEANIRRVPGGTTQPLADLKMLREFLPSPLIRSLMEAPVALGFLILLWVIHPLLAIACLLGALVQTFITWLNERATRPPLSAANRTAVAAQQYADGTLRNAQVIEAMGMLKDIHERWFAKQKEFLDLQVTASDRAGVYTSLSRLLQNAISSGLMGLGAWLALSGEMGPGGGGVIIVASIIGGRVIQPLVGIVTQWRSLIQVRDAFSRLEALLGMVPDRVKGMPLPLPRGRLVAENLLVVAPGTQMPLLRGVQFGVNPGEAVAVIGASASGKTTLARALAGIWPSMGGKARLDGVDIHGWDKTELGPNVGYLPQGIELFDGTVAENIARFGEIDMRKVEAASRAVGIHEFILTLPDGYDTDVGPEGARLSGGQRQRVGLARAFYGDPVFIVLDEPNSNLDEAGEASLAAAITEAKSRGTTFIIITHRTGLLSVADKILMLRDGSQQAFGPRDEVMAALQRANQEAAARAHAATAAAQKSPKPGKPTTPELAS